jgi:hypothetical protein
MSRIPYLAKFEHGWPVKELIQQYLQNHCDYVKRKGRDKSKPKAAAGRTKQPVPADFGESQESGEDTKDGRDHFRRWVDDYLSESCPDRHLATLTFPSF